MRVISVLIAAAAVGLLGGCAAVSAVESAASVAGSVISTTAEVTGSVIGGAARTVTGSGESGDSKSK